jgi:hypothetical protein
VVVFNDEPDFVFVPSVGVYVVRTQYDYDIFRYGPYYYVCDDGFWYRSRGYRGPFRVVDVRYVPRSVLYVPDRHWKHRWKHMDYARWRGDRDHDRRYQRYRDHDRIVYRDHDRDDDRDDDRDHGRDRSRGHGHHDDD